MDYFVQTRLLRKNCPVSTCLQHDDVICDFILLSEEVVHPHQKINMRKMDELNK